MVTIRVYGEPKGQPRPRACVRGKHAGVYDPGTANTWKGLVAEALMRSEPRIRRDDGPIKLDLLFLMPRPQRLLRKSSPPYRVPYVGKPDLDNLAKAVLDVMTSMGVWSDDAQVVEGYWSKYYTTATEQPGCVIQWRAAAYDEAGEDK
ncbi:MAG: RusA family crossover junction endodeoxyribonuclease [Candidatus Nanopelagicales bacterium]|nr:RusA family crossover junction endodeoxyribonuclease [Candidatus Nanopelagicales bacterium]